MAVSNIRPPIKFIHFARGAPHALPRPEPTMDPLLVDSNPDPIFNTNPVDSLDHHLLNNLAAYLGSTLIIDPNPLNPLLATNYLTPEQ